MIWHTAKLVVTEPSAVSSLLCAECHKDTRHKFLPCARQMAHGKGGLHCLLLWRAVFTVRNPRQSVCRVL
jgi:hypothetical protein